MSGTRGAAVAGVLLLAALVLAVPAARRPFWTKDEPRYALLAQDVLDHGRWLSPDLRGRPYLNKPPLFFWAIALVSMPGGAVTELTAVIPGVIAGVATVGGTMATGALLWGPTAGILSGLVLAVTPIHFVFGHWVLPDGPLTAGMTWALYFLLRARRDGWARAPLAGFYACVGLAALSKGPAGFSALLAAAVAATVTGGFPLLARLRLGLGLGVLAVILAPWLIAYATRSPGAFVHDVVVGDYVGRYFAAGVVGRLAQITSVLPHFLPWTVFLVAAALSWRRAPHDEGRRWVAAWTVTLWLVLGLSGVQRARYLLPVFPGLALLTGEFLARAAREAAPMHLRRAALGVMLLTGVAALLLIGAPTWAMPADTEERAFVPDQILERAVLGALALSTGIAAWLLARQGSAIRMAAAVGLGTGAMLLVVGVTYPLRFARTHDVRPLAAAVAARLGPGGIVIGHQDLRLAYDFYLRRPVLELAQPEQVVVRLAAPGPDVLITTRAKWHALAPHAHPSWQVTAERRVGPYDAVVVAADPRSP